MSCTYTYQGKTYSVSEFHDLLAAMPAQELMKHLPEEARQKLVMASRQGRIKQTDTPEFKQWFGESKVVDADGKPLVVYHGTGEDFSAFDAGKIGSNFGYDKKGFFFSPDKSTASTYASYDPSEFIDGRDGANVMPVYLSIKDPLVISKENAESLGLDIEFDEGTLFDNNRKLVLALAESGGNDGIKVGNDYIVFRPEQIKSATGNNGQFDPTNPDIRASVSFNPLDYADKLAKSDSQIANKLSHVFSTIGGDTTNSFGWFNKTLSSQFHKAKKDRSFGKVFHYAQSFIEDVARYASEAADKAPDLLPKSETMGQVWKQIKNSKQDSADQKAIAAPIFEGTLYEDENGNTGKVWTDAELRNQYKLNDRQIGLYRQYRNAINHSLETMAIAEMNKVARANEMNMPTEELSMDDLARFYSSQYAEKLKALRERYDQHTKAYEANDKQMRLNADSLRLTREKYHQAKVIMDSNYAAEQALMNREIESLEKLDKAFNEKAATVRKMQKDGYAPLMRFGKYTVDVVEMVPAKDDDGNEIIDKETGELVMQEERIFFSMFEKESEARDAERAMTEMYPNAQVSRGTASQDGWQLFGAVNPGSLEALVALTGKEDELIQRFYKDAVSNRSALKRLIHRQGIAGYSDDVVRGLASFVMSNARATASADHVGDMVQAVADIPKNKGDVKDEAVKLVSYIQNPNEEAGSLRGLLFMQFLGGSIASALVNLTQTVSTTYPFLSQYGVTPAALARAAVVAGKRMNGGTAGVDSELGRALARAEDEGVVSPHNIHAIMGNSGVQGFANNKALRLFNSVWGSMFGMAEQFNRETAFIAAYEAAQKMGEAGLRKAYQKQADLFASRGLPPPDSRHFADAFSFAKNAVNETQFILSKAARPNWARGAVGATLMTFQQFKLFYLELFSRLPAKERAVMLASLVLLAGLSGVPGADDLDDIIDTLGQMAGYNTNSRKWKDQAIVAAFGDNKMAADFVQSGVSAFLPLDVAGRLGMGNLVPATGLLKKSNTGNTQRQMSELLGAAGGFFNQITDAWGYALKGRYDLAITQGVAPKAFKDLHKAYEMARTGVYDDTKGRRVTDVTPLDAFVKALGFQPKDVADIQRQKGFQMQDIALVKAVKASVSEMWAAGINDRDPAMTANARQILADWNEKNPEAAIKIDKGAIQRRVNQMKLTAQDRIIKTAPKEMRANVKAAFAD